METGEEWDFSKFCTESTLFQMKMNWIRKKKVSPFTDGAKLG